MPPPRERPIGLALAAAAKTVSRAFDDALTDAGGSLPVWLAILSLKTAVPPTQLELARRIGIEGPTLTRHLDGLERDDLVTRRRDPDDRRAVRVELTPKGERLYDELLRAAVAFDSRLRAGISDDELQQLRETLARLEANVAPAPRE